MSLTVSRPIVYHADMNPSAAKLPLIYVSPYYDPNVASGANRRFDELCRRFRAEYGDAFTLVVAQGRIPHWWSPGPGRLVEVPYTGSHGSKFTAARTIGRVLDAAPRSIVVIESVPIPFRALRRHVHFQVAYDFRYFRAESKSFLYRLVFGPYLRRQWRRSEYMVTSSEFSIDELVRFVGYDRRRIIKSFFGVSRELWDGITDAATPKDVDLLYVGHFEKRKNHAPLLEAIALVDPTLRVALVGADNGLRAELEAQARRLGLTRTTFEAINDDARLWALYRSSRLFVYPSVYEGFGIPLIEALALGTPVICSDIPVFREVGGDLPIFFDPHDPAAIARAIRAGLEPGALPGASRRREWLKQFTWEAIYEDFDRDLDARARHG